MGRILIYVESLAFPENRLPARSYLSGPPPFPTPPTATRYPKASRDINPVSAISAFENIYFCLLGPRGPSRLSSQNTLGVTFTVTSKLPQGLLNRCGAGPPSSSFFLTNAIPFFPSLLRSSQASGRAGAFRLQLELGFARRALSRASKGLALSFSQDTTN